VHEGEGTKVGLLAGKKGIILGVANDKSIAWAVAAAAKEEGATLGFNYLNEMMQKRVEPLAESLGAELIEPLDVSRDDQLDEFFSKVRKKWGSFDFLVHSVAFANKEALRGRFMETSRRDFLQAMDISCYSFLAAASRAAPVLNKGGSILTMTYIGAVRVVPNYNLMGVAKAALEATTRYLAADLGRDGIRVNAISAGPIRTLAASGIGGFRSILKTYEEGSALGRNISQEEVGRSALYLLSDLSSGVSGEVHYVDAGFNIGIGGNFES
jgi:enoyl-[acyl-carrier protein] reductase I